MAAEIADCGECTRDRIVLAALSRRDPHRLDLVTEPRPLALGELAGPLAGSLLGGLAIDVAAQECHRFVVADRTQPRERVAEAALDQGRGLLDQARTEQPARARLDAAR